MQLLPLLSGETLTAVLHLGELLVRQESCSGPGGSLPQGSLSSVLDYPAGVGLPSLRVHPTAEGCHDQVKEN